MMQPATYKIYNIKSFTKRGFYYNNRKEKFPINENSDLIEEFWKKIKEENLCFNTGKRRHGMPEHIFKNNREFYYRIGLGFFWPNSSQITISSAK